MKRKTVTAMLAVMLLGGSLFINGCGTDETAESVTDVSVSEDAQEEEEIIITDYSVDVHLKIYDADASPLTGATISFYEDGELIGSAVTDDSGWAGGLNLTSNTTLSCTVTDSSGAVVGETDIIYEISADYESLTIFTIDTEELVQTIGVPADKTDMTARIFITEDGLISYANVTEYSEDDEPEEETEETEESSDEDEDSGEESSEDTEESNAEEESSDTEDSEE